MLQGGRVGARNLRNEGVPKERVFLVGNVMIDTLRRNLAASAEILLRFH